MLTSSFGAFMTYINHFGMYDYVAFIWFIILVFLFFLLAISLITRYPITSIFMILLLIVVSIAGPFTIKWYLNNILRPTKTKIISKKQLVFSNTFILEGIVQNASKQKFNMCEVYIGFFKHSKNKYKDKINKIKPYHKRTITLNESLDKNQTADFRVVFNDFRINPDTNITAVSECYK